LLWLERWGWGGHRESLPRLVADAALDSKSQPLLVCLQDWLRRLLQVRRRPASHYWRQEARSVSAHHMC
jgi:hypothetical protein